MRRFSGHDKRVTLNLALHSVAARAKPGLIEALRLAKEAMWDLDTLPQEAVECIYTYFDDDFEREVVAEFQADPHYLLDLFPVFGTCPLCGHIGIRWVFRVMNLKGGDSVECGSECIITWGISVKGAETAEAAKAILEKQIRQAIRKLLIAEWHKETGFDASWFGALYESLKRIRRGGSSIPTGEYYRTYRKSREVAKLERFYGRSGWLNTESKWNELVRLVNFCRAHDETLGLPHLENYVSKKEKAEATRAALEASGVVTEALPAPKPEIVSPPTTMELPFATVNPEAEAQAAEVAWVREEAAKTVQGPTMPTDEVGAVKVDDTPPTYPCKEPVKADFSEMCRELVFRSK